MSLLAKGLISAMLFAFQGSQDEKIMDSMIHAFAVTSLFFLSCVRG